MICGAVDQLPKPSFNIFLAWFAMAGFAKAWQGLASYGAVWVFGGRHEQGGEDNADHGTDERR